MLPSSSVVGQPVTVGVRTIPHNVGGVGSVPGSVVVDDGATVTTRSYLYGYDGQREASCDDATCEAEVCAADPFCCSIEYDFVCGQLGSGICDVCGAGMGEVGDGLAQLSPPASMGWLPTAHRQSIRQRL